MKHIRSYENILENLAQAKAIIRKKGIDQSDETYQKILAHTNRDGYTGIIVRLVFQESVDLQEALDLYTTFKQDSVDVGKLSKMGYDDILDLVYTDINDDKGIKYLFDIGEYKCFLVKNYEDGLEINSPSWCLKTKHNWDDYTKTKGGINFTLIDKKYVSGSTVKLPTPNTFFGRSYENHNKPAVRLGFTVYRIETYNAFDDDNKVYRNSHIFDILYKYVKDNELFTQAKSEKEEIMDDIYNYISNYFDINEVSTTSFKNSGLGRYDDNIIEDLTEKMLNVEVMGINVKEFMLDNKDLVMQSHLSSWCGVMDMILYNIYGKDGFNLSGDLLDEQMSEELFIRYLYGDYKYKWGKRYILQSFMSIDSFVRDIANSTYILFGGNNYYFYDTLSRRSTDSNQIKEYIDIKKEKNGYKAIFRFVDYVTDYPEDLYNVDWSGGEKNEVYVTSEDIEDIVGSFDDYNLDIECDEKNIYVNYSYNGVYEGE